MKTLILLISTLFVLTHCIGPENFVIEGNDNFDETEVLTYTFNFGSNWRGPSASTVCITYEYNRTEVEQFGEPSETFHYIPPGETTPIDINFSTNFEKFENGEFTFGIMDGIDSRICQNIKKIIPTNIICINEGDPSCNGVYRYTVTVGEKVDYANSEIIFIGGQPPRFQIQDEVTSLDANTYEGYLGTTFQSTVDGTKTIRINATDIQGEPLGDIVWTFKAEGTSTEISLPGSLAGVTITSGGAGQSELEISGVTQVLIGEYIAVATNDHGSHRASAFVTRGVAPFIIEGSGQSSSSSFRVGASRAGSVGETISIRAEDAQSDPSSTITWWYSRTQSGPFTAISSGGAYSISASSGPGNVGTDSTLTISNVQAGNFGYYIAVATNEFGIYSSRASLVGRAPRLIRGSGIVTSGSDNIGAQFNGTLGSTIIIRAFDEVGFPDSSYRWQRVLASGVLQDITSGGRFQITSFTSGGRPGSTFTITGVTQNELGTYRATASNGVTPDDIAESLVGSGSTCGSSSSVTIVANGDQVESAGSFDTTNANSFSIIARDLAGVPHGTVSWSYSRIRNGPRSPPSSTFTSTNTPANSAGTISFNNLADAAYGYYYARITNPFGSSECENLVGRQLAFLTGSGQIGQNSVIGIGDSLTITAQFSNGFPTGEITWNGPNGPITPTTPGYTIVQGSGVSTLTINSARDGTDFGQYSASSSNLFGSVTSTSTVSQSSVTVPPTIDKGDFVIEGNDNFDETEVLAYTFNFGSNWRGPSGSTVCITYEYNRTEVEQFGEPSETFHYIPPGETTPIDINFSTDFEKFENGEFTFGIMDGIDSLICQNIKKIIPTNIICINEGDPSCNGVYRYTVTVGGKVDYANSEIIFIGGQPPRFQIRDEVTSLDANTYEGYLGTTFQSTVDGTKTIRINATDIQGEPLGDIVWTFKAEGTSTEISLPGSLAGVTITSGGAGQSELEISGVTQVHIGEYIAVATNDHGSHRASAFVTRGVAPFIIEGSGQSSSSSFRVGESRAGSVGETISIRAEDAQSDPSSTITWWYSRTQSGPFTAISSGGAYSISASSGPGNVGTDSTLTISNVQAGHFGYYIAVATNEFGTYSSRASLVGRAPRLIRGSGIATSGSDNIGAQFNGTLGSTIIIRAFDEVGFPDSSYRWQRVLASGLLQDITSGGRVQITSFISGGRPGSTLTITGVTQNDLGTYRATASNGVTSDDIAESLVGLGSTCGSSFSVTIVATGDQVESAGRLDTTNANSFSIIARDLAGVPHGTVSWSYSRIRNGPRSPPSSTFTSTNTPANSAGTISFNNLADAAYGYYYARITNQFGSSECENLVGRQLAFLTGSGQIGQNSVIGIGDSLTITAQFSNGFPTGEITWNGPNGPITPTTPGYTIVQGSGVSTLTINSARDGTDFGQYSASSSNLFGSVTSTSTVSQSSVIVPPTIDKGNSSTIITDGNGRIGDSFQAPSGQLVTICATDLTGVEASTVQFSRIPPGGGTFVSVPNSPPFSINCQTNADGKTECCLSFTVGSNTYGTYRAQASNSAGSDAAITVVGQPPRLDSRFTIRRIRAGESSTIEVGGQVNIDESGTLILTTTDLEGQPGRNFVWTYRNSPTGPFIPLPTTSNIQEFATGNVGTLQISNIDRSMYGEYRVTANNEFGASNEVTTIVGAPPIVRFSTGTKTDGEGEIGQNFVIPTDRRLRITACVIGGYPPALANDFEFREQSVVLGSVQQPAPNENCFIYEEGEFEITCGTTITARTENIFGISNEPSSSIVFPPPTIVEGTSTCSQGSTVNSAQIGSQLCLYGRNSFDITCSLERTNIPNFSFEWQLNGNPISAGGKYSINNQVVGSSVLTVSGISVDNTGRYMCTVRSTCGDTDAASTDVDQYEYQYVCNENVGRVVCFESRNGGPQITVPNGVCDGLGLSRPPCDICDWVITQWSTCSDTTCHRGRRNRDVTCECNGVNQEDDQCNSRTKPVGMDRCGLVGVRCNRPFEWKVYSLTTCSATCGNSIRSRRVECISSITGNRVSDVECNDIFKPDENVRCTVPSCTQCVDQMSTSACEMFIGIVGDCNQHPYYVRSQCCGTCLRLRM